MNNTEEVRTVDAVIVGAGAAGIYAMHKLTDLGFNSIGFERGDSVGGAWYWNRYPGLYCDVESIDYSFSFSDEIQQEWAWRKKYSSQPEIQAYFEWVTDKLGIRDRFQFQTTVTGAVWNEDSHRWRVTTDTGVVVDARFFVAATGPLSTPKEIEFEGQASFQGEILQTASWPEQTQDFTGKRVAVLGVGSSGMQVIPLVGEQAEHLYVLQRTPSFAVPANNQVLEQEFIDAIKDGYRAYRDRARSTRLGVYTGTSDRRASEVTPEEREAEFAKAYEYGSTMKFASAFNDILLNPDSNAAAAEFLRNKIKERVDNPELAAKLTPTDYPILTRRLCSETGYYETFNRPNVTLVDLREEPIVRLTQTGLETTNGTYEIDVLILATGFDAFTGAMRAINPIGRGGRSLREKWDVAPSTYLGVAVSGFPNMFTIAGPLSSAGNSNVILAIEQHVEWIGDFLVAMRERGAVSFDANPQAEQEWVDGAAERADATLLRYANSWYTGSNIEGKPRVVLQWIGGVGEYQKVIDDVAADDYRGFDLTIDVTKAPEGDMSWQVA